MHSKKIFSLILFLFLSQSVIYASTINDSLYLRIYPSEIKGDSIPEKIYFTIANKTSNTYVTPLDFLIRRAYDKIFSTAYPFSFMYSVNLLFLFEEKVTHFFGDGSYPAFYCKFQKLYIIPPNSERTVYIKLNNYENIIKDYNWELSGRVTLAKKDSLESIINKFYPDRFNEYTASLISNDLIEINATDSLKSLTNCKEEISYDSYDNLPPDNIEKIKDAFEIVLWSYRSYH